MTYATRSDLEARYAQDVAQRETVLPVLGVDNALAEYLSRLIEQGFGHYSLKLCTRGLESLRPDGRELDLCKPDSYAETAHDGRKVAYLRARDGD